MEVLVLQTMQGSILAMFVEFVEFVEFDRIFFSDKKDADNIKVGDLL